MSRPRFYVFEYEKDPVRDQDGEVVDSIERIAWISDPVFSMDTLQELYADLVANTGKPASAFEAVGPVE